jgi:hypothetical protein
VPGLLFDFRDGNGFHADFRVQVKQTTQDC